MPQDPAKPRLTAIAPCELSPRLNRELPGWRLVDGAIERRFDTSGWRATLMVVNTIGHLAEAAGHHPALEVEYARVTVRLWTHDADDGITERDMALARKIDEVVLWCPWQDKDSPLPGPAGDDPDQAYIRHGPTGS